MSCRVERSTVSFVQKCWFAGLLGVTEPAMPKLFPLSRLLQLLDLPPDDISLQRAEVIDEEYSIQMINLMLKRARQQLIAAQLNRFSFFILRPDRHLIRASHRF